MNPNKSKHEALTRHILRMQYHKGHYLSTWELLWLGIWMGVEPLTWSLQWTSCSEKGTGIDTSLPRRPQLLLGGRVKYFIEEPIFVICVHSNRFQCRPVWIVNIWLVLCVALWRSIVGEPYNRSRRRPKMSKVMKPFRIGNCVANFVNAYDADAFVLGVRLPIDHANPKFVWDSFDNILHFDHKLDVDETVKYPQSNGATTIDKY